MNEFIFYLISIHILRKILLLYFFLNPIKSAREERKLERENMKGFAINLEGQLINQRNILFANEAVLFIFFIKGITRDIKTYSFILYARTKIEHIIVYIIY